MDISIWQWVIFTVFVLGVLGLDLGVFNRKAHAVGAKEAVAWTAVWVALALLFCGWIWWKHGADDAQEFLAGYLIEESLSVDNIFVFILIFSYFKVARKYQHRVLFWGILSAIVLRGAMIATGAALLDRFHWIIFVFGGFLIITGIRMAFHNDEDVDPGKSWILRAARKVLPVAKGDHGKKFIVREDRKLKVTQLFLVLLVVETTDVVFALDSIPAIFAVTQKPFIVYTSNVFAILGLRSLYFLLAGIMEMFRYLKLGLSAVLVFVGIKMLIGESRWAIPTGIALSVIAVILLTSILASVIATKREEGRANKKKRNASA